MKPATCSTLVGLRCCSSRPHSLRSPHNNQCIGYPSLRSWKARKETTSSAQGHGTASPGAGALQCATSFDRSNPFSAKEASTASSTLDGLQLDISLRIHERLYEFSSPSLYPLSPRNHRGARTRLARRKKEERQLLENRRRNGTKTLSLPLFKEEEEQLEKGEGLGRKNLSLPLFNMDGHAMGRVLTDGSCPVQ